MIVWEIGYLPPDDMVADESEFGKQLIKTGSWVACQNTTNQYSSCLFVFKPLKHNIRSGITESNALHPEGCANEPPN